MKKLLKSLVIPNFLSTFAPRKMNHYDKVKSKIGNNINYDKSCC